LFFEALNLIENNCGQSSYEVWTLDCKPVSVPCGSYTTWYDMNCADTAHYAPNNLISWIS